MNDSTDYVIEKGTAIKIHGNPYVLKEHAVVSGACDPARWRPAHEAFFTDESDDPNDIRQPDCAEANPNKPPQGRLDYRNVVDELLFELIGPNGEIWRIYLNGSFDGFPKGTHGANYALPLVNAMIGEMKRHGVVFSAQQ